MPKETLGAAGGLKGESPGGTTQEVPGGIRRAEAGAGLSSGTVLFHGSAPSQHSGSVVTHSPGTSQPSGGVAVLGSGPSQPPGEVAGHGPGSVIYPAVINTHCPGTSLTRASSPWSGGSEEYIEGCSPHSGPICSPSRNTITREDRPRSILKNNSCVLMQKCPNVEKKKAQRWDEMNILATYHPAGKDYGLMKVDEPSTPYHRLQDSNEDLATGSSYAVTPQALAERFATVDNFHPKVLQNRENRYSGSLDNFTKTHSSDFDQHRKAHYDEGNFLRTQKTLPLGNDDRYHGGSVTASNGGRGVMPDPEPKPVERGSKRGSARGGKDETGLEARSHVLEAKDAHADKSQPPASIPTKLEKEIDQQRKEYYIMGRYLRSCPNPELEEDTDNEQQDCCSANLPLVIEDPISTEVRLLDHMESPFQEHKAANSLMGTGTPSQPGTPLPSGSQVVSGWCQWLVTKKLNWQNPAGSEKESVNNQSHPPQSKCRCELRQGHGCLHWPRR
ncbi:uncharacterized protein LOC143688138 isoform X2 [Tamandua tetradactyla]|uniref:uncharacterized protein LOC143688138 isoform X2 n=1 Tax=Tamandua tetradactyla TaxID=48850 RepID=UPI00405455DB